MGRLCEEDGVRSMENSKTLKTAEAEVARCEFPLPDKPVGKSTDITWPANVADLSPAQLAKHMTWWSGWSSNIRYALAKAETNETAFGEQRRLAVQIGIHKTEGDYKTVTEIKAAVEISKPIQKLDAKILEAKALKKLLKALLAGYEEKYATVSREISRRQKEEYEERRNQ